MLRWYNNICNIKTESVLKGAALRWCSRFFMSFFDDRIVWQIRQTRHRRIHVAADFKACFQHRQKTTKFDNKSDWQAVKKHAIINVFNPDVPDENFFIFFQPTNCGKKPFSETDHLRKRLLFYIFCCLTFDALYAIIKNNRTLHTTQRCVPCRGF